MLMLIYIQIRIGVDIIALLVSLMDNSIAFPLSVQ